MNEEQHLLKPHTRCIFYREDVIGMGAACVRERGATALTASGRKSSQ